jgi:hypothetical protein
MKQQAQLLLVSAFLACSSLSYGSVTNAWWYSSSGTGFQCTNSGWTSLNGGTLSMSAVQSSPDGQMTGAFMADSPEDPSVVKSYHIVNTSGLTWSSYKVDIYMDQAFSISNIVSTVPGDWTFGTPTPAPNGSPLFFGPGEYVAHLLFSSGTVVPNGASLDFSYEVGFGGALGYSFADVLHAGAVPEPGTLSLGVLGAVLCGACARGRKR